MAWIDLKGPVVADTFYAQGSLVAKDVAIQLPAITFATADYSSMGTINFPVVGQIDSMEASITKIGVDLGISKMIGLKALDLEARWVQNAVRADGTSGPEGCKAFLRAYPKSIPGISLEVGSATENEFTFEITRYRIVVGGQELWVIDKLAQILKINGVDYYSNIASLL